MKRLTAGLAAVAVVALAAGGAEAHAHLVSAAPAVDGVVPAGADQIRISFSEEVIARFSGVTVKDAAGKAVPTDKASVAAADHRIMTVPLKRKLTPGVYKVDWHAVSEDTHRREGSYRFTVQ
jgi:methionine-rich copper-binding protein CopC